MTAMMDAFHAKAEDDSPADIQNLIVPSVITKNGPVERSFDVYSRLLKDRIIVLDGPVSNESASVLIAQMLHLDSEDGAKPIQFYINSPGGSVTAGMAIYDTMRSLKCDVATIGVGQCASMGSFLLAAGTKGMRYALPNTDIMMHQPSGGAQGQASDILITAKHIERTKARMTRIYAHLLDIPQEDCERLMDRDCYINTLAARELEHIDSILVNPRGKTLTPDDQARFDVEMDILRDELADNKMVLEVIAHKKARQAKTLPAACPAQQAPTIN